MSLIHNERTKLTATYLNGVAIAIFAVGGFAPVVAWLNSGTGPGAQVGTLALICIMVSAGIHLSARYMLKGLQP
jgi:hypothetical protein